MREAHDAVVTAERGEFNVKVEELKQEAETKLKSEGRFERWEASDVGRKVIGAMFGESRNERLINEEAYAMAYKRSGKSDSLFDVATVPVQPSLQVNQKIATLLERQNQIMEKDAQRGEQRAKPPLVLAPPRAAGGVRMGG